MSTVTARQFLQKAEADQTLQTKLRTIPNINRENALAEVVQIAAAAGFTFTAEDYEQAFKEVLLERHAKGEVSDEDLARVAGGRIITCVLAPCR